MFAFYQSDWFGEIRFSGDPILRRSSPKLKRITSTVAAFLLAASQENVLKDIQELLKNQKE